MRAIARLAAVRPPPRARASSSETFDIAKRAAELGVRLTRKEMASLWRARNARTNAKITQSEYEALIRERLHTQAERELLNELIVKADERALGQRMLTALDCGGTALFAVVGTQLAGEAGMHVIGATWVGCSRDRHDVHVLGCTMLDHMSRRPFLNGLVWVEVSRVRRPEC